MLGKAAPWAEFCGRITEETGLRVTLVTRDGAVVYESSAEGELESHAGRPEIKGAFAGRPTMAVRKSDTTGIATIYYAEIIDHYTALRVAYPAEYYERQERALMGQAFWGLCVLAAAAAAFALLAYRKAGSTMRELARAVETARRGEDPVASFGNDCLDGALHSLSEAVRRLKVLDGERAALNRRLEYVLANISDGVVLFRGDEILYSNASAERILGAAIPAAAGDADDPALITILERLAGGEPAGSLRAGGRTVQVTVAGDVPEGEAAEGAKDPEGAGADGSGGEGRVVILRDLTDREKYGIYKADLVGNISHELKTPLAVIRTASEVTLKDPGMPESQRTGFLETIRRNVLRLTAILDDLNYLHRLETVDEAAGAESDLQAVVGEALEAAGSDGKRVEASIKGGPVAVHGPHIASVVTNLVSNALRYSTDELVRVRAEAASGIVTVEVEDGGPAIPLFERERIFERFHSLSKSRNREKSGSGLGLSIVKHIAMIYDGEATVKDNDRGGNTFQVILKERRRPSGAGEGEGEGEAGGPGPDFSGKP
jgi:two-component system phosphate regulon sensor histidine kinase PhoR